MKKILIIADDLILKAVLEDILHGHGYNTLHAPNGREGIRLAKEHLPEVILLDLAAPEMDGATCQMIRSLNLPVRPSIIIIQGKNDKKSLIEAIENGSDDFISKPVDGLELIARIRAQSRIRGFRQELQENKKNLEIIVDITNAISSTLKTDEILYNIVKKVADITDAVRCSIVLIAEKDVGYVITSHENPSIKKIRLDLNKYPEIKEAMKSKIPVIVEDMPRHPLLAKVNELVKDLDKMNLLIVPIVWEDEVIGTLILRTRRPGKGFTEKEINLCQIIANASYHAIKNARLFEEVSKQREEMKTLAITDRLTELYNHNFFYARLDDEFNRAARYEIPLSLIMMDIDGFKRINDTYGHRIGDTVLKEMADMIKKLVRKTDIVARYGGEEFSIILPHTNMKGAKEEAERIREAVSKHTFTALDKETLTISLGVANYSRGDNILNSGDMVNLADTALYEAKKGGKNMVVSLGKK